jgi:trans-aconitate methyltransferase
MTSSSGPGKARSARLYDYLLGGTYSTATDREAGDRLIRAKPGVRPNARANRRLMTRMIRYLAGHGIAQYLDIGCGLPAAANTHEIAQSADPAARIVYVDSDPDVITYARALMASSDEGTVDYLQADVRFPRIILNRAADTLDFTKPVAIMLLAVLHQLPDTQAARDIVAALAAALPAGGYLAISHPASDINPRQSAAAASIYQAATGIPQTNRTRAQVAGFFDGLDLVDPGIVPLNHWRPDQHENPALIISAWAGLGIRR